MSDNSDVHNVIRIAMSATGGIKATQEREFCVRPDAGVLAVETPHGTSGHVWLDTHNGDAVLVMDDPAGNICAVDVRLLIIEVEAIIARIMTQAQPPH
jgi:hypothetical protein